MSRPKGGRSVQHCTIAWNGISLVPRPSAPRGEGRPGIYTVRACVAIFKIAHACVRAIGVISKCGRVMKRHEISTRVNSIVVS